MDEKDRRTAEWLAPARLEELENSAEARDVLAAELAQLAADRAEMHRELVPSGEASIHLPVNLSCITRYAQRK